MLFFLLLVSSFIIFVKNKQIVLPNKGYFYINVVWILLLFIYSIVGLRNNQLNYMFNDLRNIMFYGFVFIMFVYVFSKNNIFSLAKVIIVSVMLFSCIDILVYQFKDTLFADLTISAQWADDNRLGFTNSLVIIYLIPFVFFKDKLNLSRKWIYFLYISVGASFITVIITKSVNLIVSVAFVIIFSLVLKYYVEKKSSYFNLFRKKLINYSVFLLILAIPLAAIFYYYLPRFDSSTIVTLYNKIYLAVIDPAQLNSWQSRLITNEYAFNEFKDNIWGYGLGKTFQTFIQTGDLASDNSMYVDNTFYTVVNKMGIIGAVFFYIYLLFSLLLLYKNAKKGESQYKGLLYSFLGAYGALLISMFSTSQMFRNPVVIILAQLIMMSSFTLAKKENIQLEENSNG